MWRSALPTRDWEFPPTSLSTSSSRSNAGPPRPTPPGVAAGLGWQLWTKPRAGTAAACPWSANPSAGPVLLCIYGRTLMRRRILVVEDEPTLAMTLADRLEAEGYSVDLAPTGELALERAAADTFDLVMLDVMLPGRNGFEVCRELRQQRLEFPIPMLTS